VIAAAGLGLFTVDILFLRPWMLRWGATNTELAMPLPGDDLVPSLAYQSMLAVTIHAPCDRVWPWLAQIGQGRGGFYSYRIECHPRPGRSVRQVHAPEPTAMENRCFFPQAC
jgi:hypothetical protein